MIVASLSTALQQHAYINIGGHTYFKLGKTRLRLCQEFLYIGASAVGSWPTVIASDRVTKGKYDSRSFFLFGEGFKPKTWTCILLPGTVYNLFMCDFVVWTSVVCVVVGVPNDGAFVSDMVARIAIHRQTVSDQVVKEKHELYDSRSFFLFREGFKPKTWTCILCTVANVCLQSVHVRLCCVDISSVCCGGSAT